MNPSLPDVPYAQLTHHSQLLSTEIAGRRPHRRSGTPLRSRLLRRARHTD